MKITGKHIIFSLIIFIGALILLQGDVGSQEVNIVGSTSIQPVCEDLVEEYKKSHPNIRINVQGGGSNMGIKSVNADIADIGMCSKDICENNSFTQYELGSEGIIIGVHPSNNISDLSTEDIEKIFSGNITNWNQLGGENQKINVFVREEGSGTLDAFKTAVMNKTPIRSDAIIFNSQGSLKQAIMQDENAVGILSYSYLDNTVKALEVDGVYPSDDSIANKSYVIQRPFLFLINNDEKNEAQEFIKWLNSSEATKILEDNKIIGGD